MNGPLTNQQRDELKSMLESRRAQLLETFEQPYESASDADGDTASEQVHDTKDQSFAEQSEILSDRRQELQIAERTELDAALQRMAEDEYGYCADCGSEIGYGRLSVQPAASRCVGCQEKFEQSA